jgi:hypothetical protein
MDNERILGIILLTFCTTLVATGFSAIPSIINALLMAGIAVGNELIKDKGKVRSYHQLKLINLIDKALII